MGVAQKKVLLVCAHSSFQKRARFYSSSTH